MAGPGDRTARQAAATLGERSVMGNLWYRFHAAKPTDNLDSLNPYGNPVFRNFDDEILSYGYYLGQPYPNNDFRPFHLGPAAHRGVPLPLELASRLPPDDPAIGNSTPDMGAQPVGAAPFVAGANNAVEFPLSDFPIARARREGTLLGSLFDDGILPITITDTGDDGFERVKVNATQSKVPAADTPSFKWLEAGVTLASTPVAGLYLSEGAHYLDLSVQTGPNKFDTDGLRINVVANRPHGDNLLECPGFEQIDCAWTLEMAGFSGSANAHTGKRAVRIGPAPGSSARQRVNVSPNTTYRVTGWVRRDGLPSQARVRINVFDAAGNGVDAIVTGIDCSPEECVWPTANAYSYHEASVTIPSTGVAMELRLKAQPSRVIFDDLRVLSSSIIDNYGFERRSPSGFEAESVNWILSDGARIVADPENVRSGRRALQLKGGTDTLVTRHINLPFDAAKLRISGWIKTVGTIMPPNVQVQFGAGTSWISVFGTQVLQTDGVYKFFEGCVVQPAATKELNFRLKLLGSAVSSAYFDDILIEQTDC